MKITLLFWFFTAILLLVLAALIISYICFRIAFYVPRNTNSVSEEYSIPEGEIYEPFRDRMINWTKRTRALPHQDFEITSFDGLTLHGKYYEYAPGAPIELMFHGYRGNAERDLSGGVQRCFKLGRNILLVDQRTSGQSGGQVITFGINESRDCHSWIDFLVKHFGSDV